MTLAIAQESGDKKKKKAKKSKKTKKSMEDTSMVQNVTTAIASFVEYLYSESDEDESSSERVKAPAAV